MYGIMSGLEPRRYADGDLVQKALQLGVQPFGMSDEEIMQAIMQKQQVDDMSGASGDIGKGLSALNENVKDYVFDYTDPLEYATLPFLAPKLAMKGKKVFDAVRGSGGALSKNLRGIGAYIGTDILARDVMGYENPFGKDAQDEAAEDLAEMQDNEFIDFEEDGGVALDIEGMSPEDIAAEIGDKKTPLDKMKGLASLMQALGTSPGDVPQMTMTGDQFFGSNTFKPPGVMRMADGGIAQLAKGGRVAALKAGIKALAKKVTPKKKTKTKKETDKEKETAISKDAPKGDSFIPPEITYLAGKGKEILGKIPAMQNPKRVAARTALYVSPLAYAGSALLPDKPTTTTTTNIATGGGDMDVLDGESLKDIHYARSMARAQEAGRDKPTFMDYVASFPGSYTDKLGKDPEFAQQMMAGFVAMMTPSEGYVPRNAIADFGGAVLKEQARQEGEVPDQIKLIEAVSENPELLEAYKGFQKATKPQTFEELQTAAKLIEGEIKESLYKKAGSKKPVLRKGSKATGQPEILNAFTLYEMFENAGGDSAALAEVIAQVEGVE